MLFRSGHFGDLSVSLAWFNTNDIDLAVQEPTGSFVWFRNMRTPSGGQLEFDITSPTSYSNPIEHINWQSSPTYGTYRVFANCYSNHEHLSEIPIKILVNMGGVKKLINTTIEGRSNYPGKGKLICQFNYPN